MAAIHFILGRRFWLLAGLTLTALLAGAALSPARAEPPDLEFSLYIKGESDNVVPPGSLLEIGARFTYSGPSEIIGVEDLNLAVAEPLEWEGLSGRRRASPGARDIFAGVLSENGEWLAGDLELNDSFGQARARLNWLVVSTHPPATSPAEDRPGRVYLFNMKDRSQVAVIRPEDVPGANPIGFGKSIELVIAQDSNLGILIGSPNDAVPAVSSGVNCGWDASLRGTPEDTSCAVGRVHIFYWKKESVTDELEFGLVNSLTPSKKSGVVATNDPSVNRGARFGTSMDAVPEKSAGRLVVGAPGMHLSGGAVLFTPGSGNEWKDETWGDGIKLTPILISDDRPSLLDGDDTNSADAIGTRTGNTNLAQTYDGAEAGASVAIDSESNGIRILLGAPRKSWELDSDGKVASVKVCGTPAMGVTCAPLGTGDDAARRAITNTSARYFGEVLLFRRPISSSNAWTETSTVSDIGSPSMSNSDDIPNIGQPTVILKDRDLITKGANRDEEMLGASVAFTASGNFAAASAPQSPAHLRRSGLTGAAAASGPGSVYIWRRSSASSNTAYDGWWRQKNSDRRASTVDGGAFDDTAMIPIDFQESAELAPPDLPGSRGGQFGFPTISFAPGVSDEDLYVSHSRVHDDSNVGSSGFRGQGWVFDEDVYSNAPRGATDAPIVQRTNDQAPNPARRIVSPAPVKNGFFGAGRFTELRAAFPSGPRLLVAQTEYSDTYERKDAGTGRLWIFESKHVIEALGRPRLIDFNVPFKCVPSPGPDGDLQAENDNTHVCETDLAVQLDTLIPAEIALPADITEGAFTISAAAIVDGTTYETALDFTVGTVDEVAEIELAVGSGADGKSLPTTLAASGASSLTTLVLSILNENGAGSAGGSIRSAVFTAGRGKLSSKLGGARCSGVVCQIDVSRLSGENTAAIPLQVSHPGRSGSTTVEATVLSADGETFTAALALTFAGSAASLAISEPTAPLGNRATIESGADAQNDGEGEGDDNTDTLTLVITGADENGNLASVPHRSPKAVITGPDGSVVPPTAISTNWTIDNDADTDGAQFARNSAGAVTVTLTVASDTPLTPGQYELTLRTAGIEGLRRFDLAGPPAGIELGEPQGSLQLGGRLTFTATVQDERGEPVVDGTPVEFQGAAVDGEEALLTLVLQSGATKGGQASATWLVLNSGSVFISAGVGDHRDVKVLEVGRKAAFAPSESLSRTASDGFASYLSEAPISASALLPALDGVSAVLIWRGAWIRYGVNDEGRLIPGSVDFVINRGDILWLSG